MYLRFVVTTIDEDSHKPQGVFIAAYDLLNSGDLPQEDWAELRQLLDWFGKHLPTPPDDFEASRAIFWFRSGDKDCIRRVWEMVEMLRRYGHHVEMLKCRRLGNVLHYDAYQVIAYPSKLDGRITSSA
jgi:hypothetical protein